MSIIEFSLILDLALIYLYSMISCPLISIHDSTACDTTVISSSLCSFSVSMPVKYSPLKIKLTKVNQNSLVLYPALIILYFYAP